LVFVRGDEIAPARQDAPEGLAAGAKAEQAGREVLQLPLTEQRLLNMEANDRDLDSLGGSIPGAWSVGRAPRRHAREPEPRATQPLPP
jgi:hypothetical protein